MEHRLNVCKTRRRACTQVHTDATGGLKFECLHALRAALLSEPAIHKCIQPPDTSSLVSES